MTNFSITINVEVEPFEVPENVIVRRVPGDRAHGFVPNDTVELKDLDSKTLSELIENFTKAVYLKANKSPPPMEQ